MPWVCLDFIIRYSPFSMRQAGLLAEAVERLRARGGLDTASPQLRQLLGLGLKTGAENIYARQSSVRATVEGHGRGA